MVRTHTIRVWSYRLCIYGIQICTIHVWYAPYAYGASPYAYGMHHTCIWYRTQPFLRTSQFASFGACFRDDSQ